MNSPKPKVKAMLICDNVITEKGTNKNSLIGIFENISAKSFPCIHGRLGVYINFTDVFGKYVLKLDLVDLENNVTVGHVELPPQDYADKLESYNLVFVLEGLKFDHPGKYEFRLFANEEHCETKTFNVKKI